MTTPLSHIRIVDLTQAWAGSYAAQLLADLGAEVVKVESRSRPDPWRGGFEGGRGLAAYPDDGGPGDRPYNRAYLANSVNRNKLGITLDLGTPEGKKLFLQLVETADMVTENFTPRVLGNLGIGFETLQRVNPRVILLSMPAFGLSGPYSEYPGIGGTIEPMSGNAFLLGEPGGTAEVSGVMYPDAVAGLNGASAALAALAHRDSTGEGTHVEVSQQESMIAMLGEVFAAGAMDQLTRRGNRDLEFVPNGIYRCAGDEQWLALSVRNTDDWRALARCTGIARFAGESLESRDHRRAAEDEIDHLIGEWTSGRSASEAEQLLLEHGIPAARVRTPREVLNCPQLAASGYLVTVPQPEGIAPAPMAGIIARLSETPGDVRLPPTRHGEHSRAVLERILHLDSETLDRLETAGIIGSGPPP